MADSAQTRESDQLVEKLAARKAEKLAAADADERHLFIWAQATYPGAEIAIALLHPPAATPAITETIDTLWLATTGSAPAGQLQRQWRLNPPAGREDADVSPVRF